MPFLLQQHKQEPAEHQDHFKFQNQRNIQTRDDFLNNKMVTKKCFFNSHYQEQHK